MDFLKERVYTALNADELKVGSKVVIAKNISALKDLVYNNMISTLTKIYSEDNQDRFYGEYVHKCGNGYDTVKGTLCYLVSESEEKKLKWTDLKIGDVIKKDWIEIMVIGKDTSGNILAGHYTLTEEDLEEWEKAE
jgi:hypothetical protein